MGSATLQELAQVRTLPRASAQLDGVAVVEDVIGCLEGLAGLWPGAAEDLRHGGLPERSALRALPVAVLPLPRDLDLIPLSATHPGERRACHLVVR